jgi:molybdate transport system substrate-binding protein
MRETLWPRIASKLLHPVLGVIRGWKCFAGRDILATRNTRTEELMRIAIIAAAAALLSGTASGAEIRVLSTQATEQSYRELVPQFEKATGHKVTTLFTGTLDADKRLAAGEAYDLLIMSKESIEQHMKSGKVIQGSRVDLAHSGIGVGVKAGAPKPNISSVDALKRTLINAKSIGYSTGPSGNYVIMMFARLGIADQVKPKLKQTASGVFVGSIIASGEVEIGFQQVSELSQFEGVDYVGALPADVQKYTVFSSGILAGAKEAEAARALVRFITSPQAGAVYRRRGMEPGSKD